LWFRSCTAAGARRLQLAGPVRSRSCPPTRAEGTPHQAPVMLARTSLRGLVLAMLCHGLCVLGKHREKPTASGAWVVPTGFRAYHLDAALAGGIATLLGRGRHTNLTVLDMGAGKGLYVRYLHATGFRNVTGYEGVRNIEDLTSGRIQQREFTKPFAPCASFDIVVCLEVAEHIPRDLEPTFLENINCSAYRGLITSWAPPGQSGTGHVNMRTRTDALDRFAALGFVLDDSATQFLQGSATLYWFKKNVLALRRLDGRPSPFAVEDTQLLRERTVHTSNRSRTTALDRVRAGFAKLEARLDELHLTGSDVLIQAALAEQMRGLTALARLQ